MTPVASQVVQEDGARREGGNRGVEVLLEGVLGNFGAFLGSVGVQVLVHAAVERLAKLVKS